MCEAKYWDYSEEMWRDGPPETDSHTSIEEYTDTTFEDAFENFNKALNNPINMKRTKIYLAGPITGHDLEKRRKEFTLVKEVLEAVARHQDIDVQVISPMDLCHDHDKKWESYMRECIKVLVGCDALVLLPDWRDSRGANLEYEIAMRLGMVGFELDSEEPDLSDKTLYDFIIMLGDLVGKNTRKENKATSGGGENS